MANQDDVRRIASSLPSTTLWTKEFGFSVRNGNKERGFVWELEGRRKTPTGKVKRGR